MKKKKPVSMPKISADKIAENLKKGLGKDRAFHVAENLAKSLSLASTEDLNKEFLAQHEVRKNERTWIQVRNILGK